MLEMFDSVGKEVIVRAVSIKLNLTYLSLNDIFTHMTKIYQFSKAH